jgi:hypothetical protein
MTHEMRLAIASLKDSHRQLFFQRLGGRRFSTYKEIKMLALYVYRSWVIFWKLILSKKGRAAFSETGVEALYEEK